MILNQFLLKIWNRKLFNLIPNKVYLSIKYRLIMGRRLDWNNPQLMSEKIQLLKIIDKNDLYPTLVDKFSVRSFVSKTIGSEYLVPLLGVWENAKDINWNALPERFVLKCTHGSHTNIICKDKKTLDIKKTTRQLNKWLHSEATYYYGREWPYKYVKPRIIAEMYIESNKKGGIQDYKFLCFNGKADNVMVCSDRETGNVKFDHFDRSWRFLPYQYVDKFKGEDYTLDKPDQIDEMFVLAEKLSRSLPFVRVDLFCENGKIFFGELTFYPQSGFDTDYTEETDLYLGKKIDIPVNLKSRKKY